MDPEKAFRTLADQFIHGDFESLVPPFGRFAMEERLHLREARLLALTFPEVLRALAEKAAGDSTRELKDRLFSVFILGYLAEQKDAKAATSLAALTRDPNRSLAGRAIERLSHADDQGAWTPLYLEACHRGLSEAFDAVSYRPDSASEVLMQSFRDRSPEEWDRSPIPAMAQDVLKDYRILSSADRNQILERMLTSPSPNEAVRTDWALAASKAVNLPGLATLLRDRLDSEYANAQASAVRTQGRRFFRTGSGGMTEFEEAFTHQGNLPEQFSLSYDDVLLTAARIGVELTPLENRRLRNSGYGGDSQARLQELLLDPK